MYLDEAFGARTPVARMKRRILSQWHTACAAEGQTQSRHGKQDISRPGRLSSAGRPWVAYLAFRKERCFLRAGSKDEGRNHLLPILMSPEWVDPVTDVFS